MSKKYKIVSHDGMKMAVPIRKDHDRPAMPPPTSTHRSSKDYNRRDAKRETRRMYCDER